MSENSSNHDAENEAENADHDSHPKYDDVNMPVVVLLSILSAILTFVIIAFVQGLYYSWTDAMVREDWNSKVVTPQQQVVADQKAIRDGFYERDSGDVYVSVDLSAKKLIAAKGGLPEPKKAADPKQPEKKEPAGNPKPTPSGPDENNKKSDNKNKKSDNKNVEKDPAKAEAEEKDPAENKSKDDPAKEEKKADAGEKKEEKKD